MDPAVHIDEADGAKHLMHKNLGFLSKMLHIELIALFNYIPQNKHSNCIWALNCKELCKR